MQERKISIVCPTLTGGGAEKVAVNLANKFSEWGYLVDLVLFDANGPYKSIIDKAVNIVDLRFITGKRWKFLCLIKSVRKYLKCSRPEMVLSVIYSSNIIVGFASLGLKKTRIVFRGASTIDGIYASPFVKRNTYLLGLRVAYRLANAFIANSIDTLHGFAEKGYLKGLELYVIPNPVLPDNYLELAEAEFHDQEWPADDLKVILSIGRLKHHNKNFSFLIKAFSILHKVNQDTRLVILGEGPDKDQLVSLANDLGIGDYVHLIGFRNNVFPYLKRADVFALSSLYEGFGNVVVEALSVGTSVVSTDCPGGPKMILDGGRYGALVKLNDAQAFSEALTKKLNNPDPKDILVERANKYTVTNIASEYLNVMKGRK